MNDCKRIQNLTVPTGCVDAILDTDAFNEVDDQFAIAYMLLSPERIRTLGICAAPFFNKRATSVADGMEKSYREIHKILSLMDRKEIPTFRGSERFMDNEETPVVSEAAQYMADTAARYTPENPLYIVALGAITNVASAILLNREAMVNNTVIVWLGGHSIGYPDTKEFNMRQDFAAARIVFDCGAPLVILPCKGVVSAFSTTRPELETWLKGTTPIAEYLMQNAIDEAESYAAGTAWSRTIWDVTAVAWLLNDDDRFLGSYLMPAPVPEYDGIYAFPPARHTIRYIYEVRRDALFTSLFQKLSGR